ncbi:MAG: 4-hydroxy-3-methylbut-2-enyl diphosphate reductase [Acidobacteriia bacterium]|nr:4-hydroxy-3-methylbut-2-enyl diphosphate reductase [Terriglobia bacterium]
MNILIAEEAGFCFGVKRAMKITEKVVAQECGEGEKLYTFGPLIHNPQVINRLHEKGVAVAEDLDDVTDGTVIVRTHGIAPQRMEELKERADKVIDATCPYVTKSQSFASQLHQEGYHVLIIGDKNHPEIKGVIGFINENYTVIKTVEEVETLKFYPKLGVIAQTTFNVGTFNTILSKLSDKANEIRIFNTICDDTFVRQRSAAQLAGRADVMIIVGGRNSANTNKLVEICRGIQPRTYHIEEVKEIEEIDFSHVKSVGITTGASTPDWIIADVVERLKHVPAHSAVS